MCATVHDEMDMMMPVIMPYRPSTSAKIKMRISATKMFSLMA